MRPPISYRDHHRHRQDIDILDMDDIQKSFSKLKKGFKRRLGGKKRAPDRAGDNATGERAGSSASLQRPDPRIVVSGHDGEGSRTNVSLGPLGLTADLGLNAGAESGFRSVGSGD